MQVATPNGVKITLALEGAEEKRAQVCPRWGRSAHHRFLTLGGLDVSSLRQISFEGNLKLTNIPLT